jgi:hypothetical protein
VTSERDRAVKLTEQYGKNISDRDSVVLGLERELASLKSKVEVLNQRITDQEEVGPFIDRLI